MPDSQNSVSTLLPQLLRLFNNTVEGFEKISEAVTSNQEAVAIDLLDENDQIKRVFIPSFGYIRNQIERLDSNIKTISNFDSGQSSMRLADGSFRKIVLSKLKAEAEDLTQLNTVTSFDTKSNWFLESMMNPLLYITFDVSGQIPIDTERVITKKFLLNLDTQPKINFFENNYKGNSALDYAEFLQEIVNNGIGYILDEETTDMPPRELRYIGNFNVLRITDTTITEEVNGVSIEKTKKLFKLNSLNYTDTRSAFIGTQSLKVGDSLVVNADSKDTRYKIVRVDSSTNSVVLDLVEGYRTISIGTDILSIYSDQDGQLDIEVPIGFNEYVVMFIKPVDPDSKIPAKNWSPGVGFYTSELELTLNDGTVQNLDTYYKNQVVDFGNLLLAMAKDKIPPSTLAIKPDSPTLTGEDFKVLQINKQVTDTKVVKELEDLEKQKVTISSEIKELDKSISSKKEAIQTKNYQNSTERDSDKNELRSLITDRSSKSELFSSIVKDIDAKSKNEALSSVKPKYRVRGFFPFPDAKESQETGRQEIVQFVVGYRYLSKDGAANAVEQLEYIDGGVSRRGTVPSWQEYRTDVRERAYDEVDDKFYWVNEDVENAEKVNINMVDVPIRKGEVVEMRIRSISEAGWPSNPSNSDWSEIIRIPFPDELDSTDQVGKILEENQTELARVRLQEELDSKGVDQHIQNSFSANEKYFAHPPTEVASGFLSEDQTPVSLFDKLVEMQNKLSEFEEILRRAKGKISVKILDENGNETTVKKDQLNQIFAGYYADQVEGLTVKKGVIISKTFFLSIENSNATTLELISRLPGSDDKRVKWSEDPTGPPNIPAAVQTYYENNDTYDGSDQDYNLNKKYDLVPIALANPDPNDNEVAVLPPFQSSQVKSQFMYARFRDVASEVAFYSEFQPDSTGAPTTIDIESLDDAEYEYGRDQGDVTTTVTAAEYIWGGDFIGSGEASTAPDFVGSNDDTIEIHIDHPYINDDDPTNEETKFASIYAQLTGDGTTVVDATNSSTIAKALFRQSRLANLISSTELGKKQSMYLYEDFIQTANPSPTLTAIDAIGGGLTTNEYARTIKTSFEDSDQYLLGKQSCGSYLILASDSHDSLVVDGKTALSTRLIDFGSDNAIRIPLIFQFRMTDYSGTGSSGLGNIAGDATGTTVNLTYSKRMGFDLYDSNENIFSFDIEITAKYKSDNLSLDKVPQRPLQVALDDLRRTVSRLSPSITETRVDANRNRSLGNG